MSHDDVMAMVGKLKAVTVERGATPAEAATAASLARRFIGQIAHRSGSEVTALCPGVHVNIVARTRLRTTDH